MNGNEPIRTEEGWADMGPSLLGVSTLPCVGSSTVGIGRRQLERAGQKDAVRERAGLARSGRRQGLLGRHKVAIGLPRSRELNLTC